jgi:hypothetical protein
LKEFTVYPKQRKIPPLPDPDSVIDEDVLLMLKEDGSFHQYTDDNDDDEETDLDASWKDFQTPKQQYLRDLVKGVWDYRDGMLILAADRPDSPYPEGADAAIAAEHQRRTKKGAVQDTLLEGRVVATYEESLHDNPVVSMLPKAIANTTSTNATTTETTRLELVPSESAMQAAAAVTWNASTTDTADTKLYSLDTHLSVPTGSLKVGKFFYPKTHPSFFDQPMFSPVRRGSFSLKQVLGLLNTQNPAALEIEKFQRADFYNKTFSLTSHPIVQHKPKGNVRWSIKYNKYVHDPLSKQAQERENEETELPVPIRVMQVQFHTNNTFSSVAGLGESILRGKFDVIGDSKDQLWMQVTRFGFGRSISGSVYSEGRMLTQEDAKTYWGTIRFEEQNDNEQQKNESPETTIGDESMSASTNVVEASNDKPERFEVKGSVIMGWGLEPLPVALFIMRQVTEVDALDYDDDEDDDDDDEENDDEKEDNRLDGVDWSGAFQ